VADDLTVDEGVDPARVVLAHDPQTSGGLLAVIPADRLSDVRADLERAGVDAWVIGRVDAGGGVTLSTG
jgi:selenide,water dikinase